MRVRTVLRSTRRILVWLSDLFVLSARKTKNRQNIVLVVFTARIGDFFAWLRVASAIRQHYTAHRIILIANTTWQPFATTLPFWDEAWPLDRSRFGDEVGYRRNLAKRVAAAGASTCIVFERELRINDAIARLSGASIKLGPDGGERLKGRTWELCISDRWFTEIIKMSKRCGATALDSQLAFCNALGIKPTPAQHPLRILPFNIEMPGGLPKRYAVLAIGASFQGRKWPIERFAEIAERLWKAHRIRSVICGDTGDIEPAKRLCNHVQACAVIDLTDQTNIQQLTKLIAGAALVVGNESGGVHIAAATATPCVVVAGGGDFGRLIPYTASNVLAPHLTVTEVMPCYGCNWKCIYAADIEGSMKCIAVIQPEKVWQAIEFCLNASSPH